MTATDELRRLLDERGVEWKAGFDVNFSTEWDGFIAAQLLPDSETLVMSLTPKQAIVTTLGVGACRNIDDDYDSYFECSICGCHVLCDFYGSGYGEPRFCPGCGRRVEKW